MDGDAIRWKAQQPVGLVCVLVGVLGLGCQGLVDEPGLEGPTGSTSGSPALPTPVPAVASLEDPAILGPSGIRRLTRTELRYVLADVFDYDADVDLQQLPLDASNEDQNLNPFDNDYTLQLPSAALIAGLDSLSRSVASAVVTDAGRRTRLVGCSPSSAGDVTCFRQFVSGLGRRLLRRDLTPDEEGSFEGLLSHAEEANDFNVAVELAVRALLMHMEFVYRVEIGTASGTPGLFALNDYELASRLAFLMWGSVPDAALLDAAAAGELQDPAVREAQALRLLADPRTERQIQRLHSQWVGYDEAATEFQTESGALVRRVILEDAAPWTALFTATETYVTADLAAHYGLPSVATPAWVAYGPERGGGLLSHASFLGIDGKFGDTSPTMRGRNILRRLMCTHLPEPPDNVDVDNPPTGSNPNGCKVVRYDMRYQADCAGCHGVMDPLGFGLENFDDSGQFRATEPGRPDCEITGEGTLPGDIAFRGPRELGEQLAASGALEACATEQFFKFASGRAVRTGDQPLLEALRSALGPAGDFAGLLLAYASSEGFRYRIIDNEL